MMQKNKNKTTFGKIFLFTGLASKNIILSFNTVLQFTLYHLLFMAILLH